MSPEDMAATHAAAFSRSRPWSADEFAGLLAQRICHVTGDAGCFALFRVIADEAELLTIATHPDHRRQGKARVCMDRFHDEARALGATRAFLEVASDNAAAQALYRAAGYRPCGWRSAYYRAPDGAAADAILMSRDLTPG